VPDPGEPTTTPYPDSPTGGFAPVTSYQITTAGGAVVDIDIPGPAGGPSLWKCGGCAAGELYGGDASELAAMVSAGTHAVRCGSDILAVLDHELAAVRAEMPRIDPKAGGYLQLAGVLAGAGLAVLASAGDRLPTPAIVAGAVTAVTVLAAVTLLALACRPNLGGDFGFVAYANSDPASILARLSSTDPQTQLTPLHKARELWWRSQMLHTKYRRIRQAVPLLMASYIGAAVTAAITLWTGAA
jgi:hypothetical protein